MEAVAFQIKLHSDTIKLPDAKRFIGKDVIVTIVEMPGEEKQGKRNWRFIGAVKLDGQLDDRNIRDLAYE